MYFALCCLSLTTGLVQRSKKKLCLPATPLPPLDICQQQGLPRSHCTLLGLVRLNSFTFDCKWVHGSNMSELRRSRRWSQGGIHSSTCWSWEIWCPCSGLNQEWMWTTWDQTSRNRWGEPLTCWSSTFKIPLSFLVRIWQRAPRLHHSRRYWSVHTLLQGKLRWKAVSRRSCRAWSALTWTRGSRRSMSHKKNGATEGVRARA